MPPPSDEDGYLLSLVTDLGALVSRSSTEKSPLGIPRIERGENPVKALARLRRLINQDDRGGRSSKNRDTLREIRFVARHVLPLAFTTWNENEGILDKALLLEITKILVLLTMPSPAYVSSAQELKTTIRAHPSFWTLLMSQLEEPLQSLMKEELTSEEEQRPLDPASLALQKTTIELLLWLVRNLLSAERVEEDAAFLEILSREMTFDTVAFFATRARTSEFREWSLITLDICAGLAGRVASAKALFRDDRKEDEELHAAKEDSKKRMSEALRTISTRHSRFGGLYRAGNGVVGTSLKSLSEKLLHDGVLSRADAQARRGGRRRPNAPTANNEEEKLLVRSEANVLKISASLRECRVLKSFFDQLTLDEEGGAVNLLASVLADIQREDARLLSVDHFRFQSLLRFLLEFSFACSTEEAFHREGLRREILSEPIFKYAFQKLHVYTETKNLLFLTENVQCLLALIRAVLLLDASQDVRAVRDRVYEANHEGFELWIPRLLRESGLVLKGDLLKYACFLADASLDLIHRMSKEGLAIKVLHTKRTKEARAKKQAAALQLKREASIWTEGATRLVMDVKTVEEFKHLLQHEKYGDLFTYGKNGQHKRTLQQLIDRHKQVKDKCAKGFSMMEIFESEAQEQEQEKAAAAAAAATTTPSLDEGGEAEESRLVARAEVEEETRVEELLKSVDFEGVLRQYIHPGTVTSFVSMADPLNHEGKEEEEDEVYAVCARYFRALRGFRKGLGPEESFAPILFHVSVFAFAARVMQRAERSQAKWATPGLADLDHVLRSTMRDFFRRAEKHSVVYVEALFWRTKTENLELSRGYVEPVKRVRRSRAAEVVGNEKGDVSEEELNDLDEEEFRFGQDSEEEEEEEEVAPREELRPEAIDAAMQRAAPRHPMTDDVWSKLGGALKAGSVASSQGISVDLPESLAEVLRLFGLRHVGGPTWVLHERRPTEWWTRASSIFTRLWLGDEDDDDEANARSETLAPAAPTAASPTTAAGVARTPTVYSSSRGPKRAKLVADSSGEESEAESSLPAEKNEAARAPVRLMWNSDSEDENE